MTRSHASFNLLSVNLCLLVVLVFSCASEAQNAQPKPAPVPFAAQPQASPAELENFPPQLLQELSTIKATALSDDYAYPQVAHLTENIGPRISGSLQAQAAVDYVAAELRQLGLEVHLEEVK